MYTFHTVMKIFSVLLLVPAIAAFAPSLAVRTNKKPLGLGAGMEPVPSIPKQRESGGASSATTAYAIPGSGYLDTLSAGNTVERVPVIDKVNVVEQHNNGEMCVFVLFV